MFGQGFYCSLCEGTAGDVRNVAEGFNRPFLFFCSEILNSSLNDIQFENK